MSECVCTVHAARETFEEWFVIFIQLPSEWLFAKSKRNTLYNEMLYFNCLQRKEEKRLERTIWPWSIFYSHCGLYSLYCIHTWHSSSYNIGNGRMQKNWSTWKLFNAQIYAHNWKQSPDLPQKQSQFFHRNNCGRFFYCTAHTRNTCETIIRYKIQVLSTDRWRHFYSPNRFDHFLSTLKKLSTCIFTCEKKYFLWNIANIVFINKCFWWDEN